MTAEIAILNRFGVALAADSAVTIANERVWKATNKIFSLGPIHDVAVMIFGGGDFLGCPWETIIKSYRSRITKAFASVEEYAEDFIDYLSDKKWSSKGDEKLSVAYIFVKEIEEFRDSLDPNGENFEDDLEKLLLSELEKIRSKTRVKSIFTFAKFKISFTRLIMSFLKEIFEVKLSKKLRRLFRIYLFEYLRRDKCFSGGETGLVFSGFGSAEIYPVCIERIVDGRYEGAVRSFPGRVSDFNSDRSARAVVVPFAQRDMTNVFMEGMSSALISYYHRVIVGLLDQKTDYFLKNFVSDKDELLVETAIQKRENEAIAREVLRDANSFRQQRSVNPLMEALQSLPREEMGAMAEALVELTSLRRKIDSSVQSVAGPVDVAFISKGDGVVWLKRKHYFQPELNGDFFERRRGRLSQ